MGILEKLKAQSATPKQLMEEKITQELQKLFYLPKKPKEESDFIFHVLTRGTGEERNGLHASDILAHYSVYNEQEALSKLQGGYNHSEEHNVDTMRIFEHGNAIHEKWQRLFIRGGMVENIASLDSTLVHESGLQYSPDAVIKIPRISDKPFLVEIKSQTTYIFMKNKPHDKAREQLCFYLWLHGAEHGFTLVEDKNTQKFRIEYIQNNTNEIAHLIERFRGLTNHEHNTRTI